MQEAKQLHLLLGSRVKINRGVVVTGSQHVGAHFLRVQLPNGIEGEVVGDGMYNAQKVVQFTIHTDGGGEVTIRCPMMLSDLTAK